MSTARDRDLERWEQGALSMSELVALHGSEGAAGLVAIHRRMSALGATQAGDAERTWRVIRERLPDLAGPRRTTPHRRRLTRPLAIAAAAILIAGTAYAGSPNAVQRYLTSFWHTVQGILDVDVAGNAPADADRPFQGGGQGDRPAGAIGDAEDREADEVNEDGDQPAETSERDDGDEGNDDENGSDDGEVSGDFEGDEPGDDDSGEAEDDGDDQPEDDGNVQPEEDDVPEAGGDETEGDTEDD